MSELNKGDKAPGFCLVNQENDEICLDDYKGKYVVLYFYPKDNTPGCTTEACEFTERFEDFKNLDAVIIGISPDSPKKHSNFINKYNLKHILLADEEHEVIEKYGQWVKKKMYGKEYFGVNRSTFIISPKGEIIEMWPKVKAKGHAEEVKVKLEELKN